MTTVLDNSVAMAWLLRENLGARAGQVIVERGAEMMVPALFWTETAYVLGKHVRRGAISLATRDFGLARLARIDLATDLAAAQPGAAFDRMIGLADRYGLTAYDAVYLELAIRSGADLATFDGLLAAAAQSAGVTVVGP